jgi:hypothetical protein
MSPGPTPQGLTLDLFSTRAFWKSVIFGGKVLRDIRSLGMGEGRRWWLEGGPFSEPLVTLSWKDWEGARQKVLLELQL